MIKEWFLSFKHWNGEAASLSRLVWLKIRGMPLNAWEFKSFKRIAEVWGELLTLDQETIHEESFDVGRLLMVTSCKHEIDDWINITVKGRNYSVHVWEEECNDPFDVNGIKDRDHLSNFNNEVQKSPCKDSASQIRITTKNGIEGTPYCTEKSHEEEDILIKNTENEEERENLINCAENKEEVAANATIGENLVTGGCILVNDQSKKSVNEEPTLELINAEVVESQFSKSAESPKGSHSEEVQETPIQFSKELQVDNHKDTVGGIQKVNATPLINGNNNLDSEFNKLPAFIVPKVVRAKKRKELRALCATLEEFERVSKLNLQHCPSNSQASVSSGDIAKRNEVILKEISDAIQVNKKLNVKYHESDEVTLNRLLQLEVEELKRRNQSAVCF
ncbi:hypothetical protein Vadar_014244 [Vaccinium darrowii]|uniref:Uncharacterized protein n=1 Tax=Vaccinium darrowii TaxID=229202 RepID=A0ACB7XQJ1_9ERIC|nr:hypothetical protein Vadar_014244 [Vaccinium darrowii]